MYLFAYTLIGTVFATYEHFGMLFDERFDYYWDLPFRRVLKPLLFVTATWPIGLMYELYCLIHRKGS